MNDTNNLNRAVDLIFKNFQGSELPVRFQAALTIHKLLENEVTFNFLKPALSQILQKYLDLMNEIDSEDLVTALEEVVSHFKDDIYPFASELTEQLVNSYHRLSQVGVDDDGGESALAAVGCVTTIRRIIESCQNNKPLLQ